MSSTKLAIVTGANKGIGLAIVKGLCETLGKGGWKIMLTSRNDKRGQDAVVSLKEQGLSPIFEQLDVTDKGSIAAFTRKIKETYGGLDLLVNNAGVGFPANTPEPIHVQAELTLNTNYFGALNLTQSLLPLMRSGGRVMTISSRFHHMMLNKLSDELKRKFFNPQIKIEELNALMTEFVASAKDGTLEAKGWPVWCIGASKVGTTIMTIILGREAQNGHVIACMCPGYVDTDMSSHKGKKTPVEGADTVIWFANLSDDEAKKFNGKFLAEREEIDFDKPREIWF